ncbi:GFA family protein [Hydrocarboniphaga effusa]|jgi:hypothetical protein|uniref:CENP-V/GFA domain-containing protein n=1 Tax=Hydrocarboniphaga effusa AP103 TaxID=1172194 RepID=I8T9Z6_9GAMM|nr:GFA family protein [Hydrocarboniphaga effusa]EIT70460.1 hypothetical protein WQQ_05970 [Hydrocarboniphaga effusa AP103]
MTHHAGGCVCGAIRYQLDSEPLFVVKCHCRDCQRSSGTDGAVVMGVASKSFRITTGQPASYPYTGDSGQAVERFFCSACGAPLYTKAAAAEGLRFVRLVSLDDSDAYAPGAHIYCASAKPWTFATLPKFDLMPPS